MERARTGESDLEYEVSGTGEPVVFIHGALIADSFRPLLAWLPHAEGFVLPGATHFMQLQNPRGLAEALAAFWRRHPLHGESS